MSKSSLSTDAHSIEFDELGQKEEIFLEETFYILSKKNTVFRVRLTRRGLCLCKETAAGTKEQTIPLDDIIGCRCMRSKRRAPGAGSCVCSSLPGPKALKVVEEGSGDSDENDSSAYLYIYAYILKLNKKSSKRERTTITLRFRSFDKFEDNNKEAQKWKAGIRCLINNVPISQPPPTFEKKFLIFLNPKSGAGKARENFQQKVAPMLNEAEIPYDLQITKYAQFAREFVRTRNIYNWRGIIVVGGDGILYEVINGLFERLDWHQALEELPVGLLPSGSGNGLARTIADFYNEPYDGNQLIGFAMALVRAKTTPMDIVRVETKKQILFSFLSIGWGLFSDIDIESERLRMIGGQRFTIWALARLISRKTYKGAVSYIPIKDVDCPPSPEREKKVISHSVSCDGALDSPDIEAFADCEEISEGFQDAMNGVQPRQRHDSWYSLASRKSAYYSTRGSSYHSATDGDGEVMSPKVVRVYGPGSSLPALTSDVPSHWVKVSGEFVMVHVASQSYLGEDMLFAPRSRLADGVLWMVIIKAGVSRPQLLQFLLGLSSGAHAHTQSEHITMVPVSAFRIVPEDTEGHMVVDGELVDYGPVQAEVFPNMVNLIVPSR